MLRGLAFNVMLVPVLLAQLQGNACASQQPLPVPAAVVYPGEPVDKAPLVDKLFTVPDKAAASYVLARSQLTGLVAKRPLLPGKPIPLSYLKPRDSILQGTPTKAVYQVQGLTITTTLIPLQAGSTGDLVDARNTEFNTVVKARVMPDGSLQVGEP